MRIAIFGTGAVGGYFGAHLARAGEEVTFVARGAQLEALRAGGLAVETPKGTIEVRPARATGDPAEVGPVDLVVVAVKTWQVAGAARAAAPMVGPETTVLPLQNGVEAAGELAAVLGPEPVLGGLCGTLSRVVAPGRILAIGDAHFVELGELDRRPGEPPSARAERVRAAFERAGVRAEIPSSIHVALWEKLLFVVSLGGVGALARAPVGVLREQPGTRRMLETAMREIEAVARARGIELGAGVVARSMAFVDSLAPGGTASLQRDLAEGRPSELEAWNGAVVRLGREANVPTPLHETIYHALLPLELRARGRLAFP